jgi:hypothetical protein
MRGATVAALRLLVAAALVALAFTATAGAEDEYDCGYLAETGCAETNGGSGNGPARAACRIDVEAVFWTGTDWERLGKAIAANRTPCGEYWISIPPLAANKKGLRVLQDDVIRALGVHPVAEFTAGELTGWGVWVNADPNDSQTWFTAGVAFRQAMWNAGYRGVDETWLLNEFDRSTMRDAPRGAFPEDQNWAAFPRAAMIDLAQGLYYGAIGMEPMPGVIEIGIHHRHQNMPDDVIRRYKSEVEAWLADNSFWSAIAPTVRWLGVENYADVRNWAPPGSSRGERRRYLEEYQFHLLELIRDAPPNVTAARELFERTYLPFANSGYRARGGEQFFFRTGHGQTMVDATTMQHFVSEQVHMIRHYAGSHPQGAPAGRIGFSWQPCNRVSATSDVCEAIVVRNFVADIDAISARMATAIQHAYRQGGASQMGACRVPDTEVDWCAGSLDGAAFTDSWSMFDHWG